jgi:hypothetical protein
MDFLIAAAQRNGIDMALRGFALEAHKPFLANASHEHPPDALQIAYGDSGEIATRRFAHLPRRNGRHGSTRIGAKKKGSHGTY